MCPSKYCFKRHKSTDQKVFTGCNLAWLQKKGHYWDNWIQRAKHKGTFILFTFHRYIYNHSLLLSTNYGVKTWYTVILTTYFSFFFFLFMYTFFSFLFFFSFSMYKTLLFWSHNLNFTSLPDNWFTSTLSPQLEQKHTLFECSLTLW